jgi:hypothetical protein
LGVGVGKCHDQCCQGLVHALQGAKRQCSPRVKKILPSQRPAEHLGQVSIGD